MDDFARLPSDQRRPYFDEAAARLGMNAQLVEKDFWVCWSLNRLFALGEFQDHLTFKGGTSLSKVYRVIERFSEDIDVAIERAFLGFGGEDEPEAGRSKKEQDRRVGRLKTACQTAIHDRLGPQLRESIAAQLGTETGWTLMRDPADRDDQTLLFEYPPSITTGLSRYFAPSVKIELGARSDHFPVEHATVSPYLSGVLPGALPADTTRVRVLGAERTFWEKATILHMLRYQPEEKPLQSRMSRHYYDVFRLAQSAHFELALEKPELLDRVAKHKSVFFKVTWAHYDQAHRGTLRLMPAAHIVGKLKQDYDAMSPMFFGEAPAFQEILDLLPELEKRINQVTG